MSRARRDADMTGRKIRAHEINTRKTYTHTCDMPTSSSSIRTSASHHHRTTPLQHALHSILSAKLYFSVYELDEVFMFRAAHLCFPAHVFCALQGEDRYTMTSQQQQRQRQQTTHVHPYTPCSSTFRRRRRGELILNFRINSIFCTRTPTRRILRKTANALRRVFVPGCRSREVTINWRKWQRCGVGEMVEMRFGDGFWWVGLCCLILHVRCVRFPEKSCMRVYVGRRALLDTSFDTQHRVLLLPMHRAYSACVANVYICIRARRDS